MESAQMKDRFEQLYGNGVSRLFIGPARVNLIGEHTDHQGGYVLPCAISLRSACLVRPRTDGKIRLAATDLDGIVEADVCDLSGYASIPWGGYPIGVAYIMKNRGYFVGGMDMLFDETVPHGSGLSSSAAIEVATATAIATISSERVGTPVDMTELALIAQETENKYIGMDCGIMDQFSSAMGKKDNAIFLRCSDLSYRYVPADFGTQGYTLMICNTGKPRALVKSAYNTRLAECKVAFTAMKEQANISCLADLTPEMFEQYSSLIQDPIAEKRARHVVLENDRTRRACDYLENGRLLEFGRLMDESHTSLKELFEVTGKELDVMVDAARAQKGVIGARMTGAGFGGCAIALVEEKHAEAFMANVSQIYSGQTGYRPEFYPATISDGAGEKKDVSK